MEKVLLALFSLLLLSLFSLTSAQRNDTGSGSGSGNGTIEIARNCSDLQCSHGCNDTDEGPLCYCPRGYSLDAMDMMTCMPCPGGLFGINCASRCDCGETGNTCDRVNGSCQCNPCYTGNQCEMETSSVDCFVQFLEIADKSRNNLRNRYGEIAYPTPPSSLRQTLAATIMGNANTYADLIPSAEFESISRTDVDQGPLVKLSWQVDRSVSAVRAQEALDSLSNRVKLGDIRATYIAQDSATGITTVTLNSGVKEDNP